MQAPCYFYLIINMSSIILRSLKSMLFSMSTGPSQTWDYFQADHKIRVELLEINLSVDCIAKLLGISARTVNRWMREFGLSITKSYSNATDQELDDIVQQIKNEMPTTGYQMVKRRLKSMGIHVQWRRVTASVHWVDSFGILSRLTRLGCIVWRTYSVKGPLSLWHVETNHKGQHCCIDC